MQNENNNNYKTIGKDADFADIIKCWDPEVPKQYRSIECGYGWSNVIRKCHEHLLSMDEEYKIVQIKEKFGMLRYYFTPSKHEYFKPMEEVSFLYEKESVHVCEVCGSSGSLRRKSGIGAFARTVCDSHYSDG
jgi:hypothetical protein